MLSGRLLVRKGLKKLLRKEGIDECLPRLHKLEHITGCIPWYAPFIKSLSILEGLKIN